MIKSNSARRTLRNFLRGLETINGAGTLSSIEMSGARAAIAGFYDELATRTVTQRLWNWGLFENAVWEQTEPFLLAHADPASDGLSEQLYCFAAMATETADERGRSILETGCGLGEGLAFLARRRPADRYVGVDISAKAIDAARRRFAGTGLRFEQADAAHLPCADGSVDCLLAVESVHNYPSLSDFLSEAARVLRPGGHLSMVDIFTASRARALEAMLRRQPAFDCLIDSDISELVRGAIAMRLAAHNAERGARHAATGGGWLRNRLRDEGRKLMFGADFLSPAPGAARRSVRRLVFGAAMEVDSYRHILLQRR